MEKQKKISLDAHLRNVEEKANKPLNTLKNEYNYMEQGFRLIRDCKSGSYFKIYLN